MGLLVRNFLSFLVLVLLSLETVAATNNDLASLIKQAEETQLASHVYWHKLLHYKKKSITDGATVSTTISSEIITPNFFISPLGSTNPAAELNATLKALFIYSDDKPDSHAQCRYIARYKWLRKQLDWSQITTVPAVSCAKYNNWSRNNQIQSLSVIFATGYLDNPASYYGHILLKFNSKLSLNTSVLLDDSLNFGATIPENENPLVYIFKGLLGGYTAGFSANKFYKLNHTYIENDLRDMWQYELNLSDDELDQIISHSWELLGSSYVYYYLKQNCAFRMAELLGLVIDEPLLPDYFWSNPVTIFERLAKITRGDIPLVKKVTRIPSRQNRFYESFLSLTNENQNILSERVSSVSSSLEKYNKLTNKDKISIIDTLLEYTEFLIISDKTNKKLLRQKQEYLLERALLPAENLMDEKKITSMAISPPHKGPLPMMFRFGVYTSSQFQNAAQLQFRPVYYDLLELDQGRIPNSSLTMMDATARYFDQKLILTKLDFIKVETLNIAQTNLPGDGGFAWNFNFGLDQQDLACQNCLVPKISGGIGKAYSLFNSRSGNVVMLAMFDSFVQSNYKESGTFGIAPRVEVIFSTSRYWKSLISFSHRKFINDGGSGTDHFKWQTRFGDQRDWDIRLSYEKFVADEYHIATSFYW
ncbi:hypothetical protein MNBD_GAMMA22-182 [hydrothermal vent metagenome]|uniref:Uncharacterized protein n=1 Tax=hydrothermal vent metagenome TaxID=652676 RepID=A0A3B1A7Z3_9ZZZZ